MSFTYRPAATTTPLPTPPQLVTIDSFNVVTAASIHSYPS